MIKDPELNEWADLLLKTVPFDMTIDSPNWWALMVVRKLLDVHKPSDDEGMSYGYLCLTCCDGWPCDVYQTIRDEARTELEDSLPKRRPFPMRWGSRVLDWLSEGGPDLFGAVVDLVIDLLR